ncbi:acyltransferase [Chitinophaga sp. Mgbs1]|uniref:Acyltransferase n=1 Tax=Chitinophaga solisilvae TaxID=1233460 RepID=A0A433WD58_9BACT|nr:acyltransferase [Chitinophaga solisilvae]
MKTPQWITYIFSFRPADNGRHAWVDYAKGMAMIFVIYRHVLYGLLYSGQTISDTMMNANEALYGFRMPLFFFLSGLFFASSLTKRGPYNLFINKVNTLLHPYIVWCVIQLTLQIVFSGSTNHKRGIENYIDILIHPRAMLQQWYLFALFNVSVLYLFSHVALKLKWPVQIALGLIFLGMIPLAGDISTISDVMYYYVFFALGHVAAPWFFNEKIQERLSNGYLLLAMLPVFAAAQYFCLKHADTNIYIFSALATIGGIVVIMLSMLLSKYKRLVFIKVIGHYSLYIYLLHLSIIFPLRLVILRTHIITGVPLITAVLMAAGIFLSILLYRLCLLLKLKFLFVGVFREQPYSLAPVADKKQMI